LIKPDGVETAWRQKGEHHTQKKLALCRFQTGYDWTTN